MISWMLVPPSGSAAIPGTHSTQGQLHLHLPGGWALSDMGGHSQLCRAARFILLCSSPHFQHSQLLNKHRSLETFWTLLFSKLTVTQKLNSSPCPWPIFMRSTAIPTHLELDHTCNTDTPVPAEHSKVVSWPLYRRRNNLYHRQVPLCWQNSAHAKPHQLDF